MGDCSACEETLNDDYLPEHRWLWHGGPMPEPASNLVRCCMGGTLDEDRYRCWNEADGLWCPACLVSIEGDGPESVSAPGVEHELR